MLTKKSTSAIYANGNVRSVWPVLGLSPSSTASLSSLPSQLGSALRRTWLQSRSYVTAPRDDGSPGNAGLDGLHLRWPPSAHPTPYEIFGWEKEAAYEKKRYYELVKLYHPDRSHAHRGIRPATKLERYRLVVAANDILRDPVKRRAYDVLGAGWPDRKWTHEAYREADRSWRQKPGNAANNATWEDWERWHNAKEGKKQEPTFMSNGGFFGVISVFILVGAWGQTARASRRSLSVEKRRDQQHEMVGREMTNRQAETGALSRNDRVENFLRQRDGWAYSSGHMPIKDLPK